MLFLGLPPLALVATRRHVFVAAAKSILMIAAFTTVVLFSHGMGVQNLMSPALAAWAPAIVLVPAAVWMSGPLRE